MKTLKLLTVIRQDVDPLSRAVWKSKVLYSCCYEEGQKEKPFIMLDKNKLVLNESAFELLNAQPGNMFDIVYRQQGTNMCPCLVNKTKLNQEGGRRLNKSMTISCKGTAHEQLIKYGMMFHLVEYKDKIWFDMEPVEGSSPGGVIITPAVVETGSDFDVDGDIVDQTEYNTVIEGKEYTKEEDLDDIINNMFN